MTAPGKVLFQMRQKKPTQYPGITSNGDGTFRLRGRVRNKKTGEAIDLDRTVEAKDPHEANALRIELLADLAKTGPAQAQERPRLKEYAQCWFAGKLPKLKASTQELYATLIDEYLVPGPIDDNGTRLGDCYVDAITLHDLNEWRDRQAKAPTKYGRPPSPVTVNGRIAKLKEIFRDAVHDLDLPKDPTLRLESVRVGKKRKNSLSAEELSRFLTAAKEHRPLWYPFFYALAFTGLRFGELTVLRWRDLDRDAMCVRIEASQWQGIEDTTKTEQERVIPLFPELLEVLEQHREHQIAELRAKAKRAKMIGIDALKLSDDALVFAGTRSKKHMHNTAPRKALAYCLEKAGIDRRFTIHGQRHTFNNLIRQHTKDVVLTQSMTGHATVEMSGNYSDVEIQEKREAVEGLRLIVGGQRGSR